MKTDSGNETSITWHHPLIVHPKARLVWRTVLQSLPHHITTQQTAERSYSTSVSIPSSNSHFVLPLTLDECLLLSQAASLALQQQVIMNRFYPPHLNLNYQIQNGLGVLLWVVHAPSVIVHQGLLHRT